jgi:hypothetical protein
LLRGFYANFGDVLLHLRPMPVAMETTAVNTATVKVASETSGANEKTCDK